MAYRIGIDHDRDGFICWDAASGDSLNQWPTPITHDGYDWQGQQGSSPTVEAEDTAYGRYRFNIQATAGLSDGLLLGQFAGNIDTIPISALTQYTVKFWARGVSGYSGVNIMLVARDQTTTQLTGSPSFNNQLTASWQAYSMTFTTLAGSTHLRFEIRKQADATLIEFDVAGLMLIAGATAPDGFNAGAASNLADNVTARLHKASWRIGMQNPFDLVAQGISGSLLLYDPDGSHLPEQSGYLEPGQMVAVEQDTTRLLTCFTGHVVRDPLALVDEVTLVDPLSWLAAKTVTLELQTDTDAGSVIDLLLMSASIRPPDVGLAWLLGVSGQSELGETTRLASAYPTAISTGKTTFAYVGPTIDGRSGLDGCRQMAEAERGRFYVDRDGDIVFDDRHAILLKTASSVTLSNQFRRLDYSYAEGIVNRCLVRLRPRSIGAAGSTIWTVPRPQRIEANATRVISARYLIDEKVAGLVDDLLESFTFNTERDGTGGNADPQYTVRASAGRAIVTVRNTSNTDVFLVSGNLKGQPLLQGDPVEVEASDGESLNLYGDGVLLLDLAELDDAEDAENLARYEVSRRKDLRGWSRVVGLNHVDHLTTIRDYTLFDRVTITETKTGHSDDYFIVAEQHDIHPNARRHQCWWTLEPADAAAYWILGTSLLGTDTRLAY